MFQLPLSPELRANFRRLYADIFWFGVLSGSTLSFLSIYAARLGADSLQISLLNAGPAVINLLVSLPAGRWLQSRQVVPESFRSAFLQRLGYLAILPLPWLFADRMETWMIVLITLLMSFPGTVLAIAFNALFAETVPPEYRGEVVGKRNALLAVSTSGTALLCGQLLDGILFPLNYQIVFGLGALGAAFSTYYVGKVRSYGAQPAPRVGRPLGDRARPGMPGFLRIAGGERLSVGMRFLARSGEKPLLRPDLLRGSFGRFLVALLFFYIFQYLPLPLFPLYMVNELHLSDGAISLGSALLQTLVFLVSLRISEISARRGHRWVMLAGALLFGAYPLLLGLARDATLFWAASVVGGFVWALMGAGLVNRLMEKVPERDRPAYLALHNLTLNLGILVGSLAAPLLGEALGLRGAILAGAGLRVLAALLLAVWA